MVQEVIFLSKFLVNLGFKQNSPPISAETCIHCQSLVRFRLKAPFNESVGDNDQAKHIDLRKHFVHDACQQGILQLRKIDPKFNGAYVLN